ncbi:MAG: DUF6088 family protein [Eubacteriaceae bacterium]
MELFQYLIDNYGYDEPILSEDLNNKLNYKNTTLRQNLKRLVDNGQLERYKLGIYYIPKPNSLLKKGSLSFNKVISKKYLYDEDKIIGYRSGIAFANDLKLTTQTPGSIEVVTNKETNRKRNVKIGKQRVILRKPRTKITDVNYKVLQALDLIANINKYSDKTLARTLENISKYLEDVKLNKDEIDEIIKAYPMKTKVMVYESGLYDVLTRR